MHRVVVFSNGETWEMAEGCRLCEITDEQFQHMESGIYPYQLEPVPTGILLDEHYGKEAEHLRKGVEDLIKDYRMGCSTVETLEVCDVIIDTLQELIDSVDAVDSLHYLADQKNKETIQMEDPLKQLQADITRILSQDYNAVYDMRADIQLVLDEVDAPKGLPHNANEAELPEKKEECERCGGCGVLFSPSVVADPTKNPAQFTRPPTIERCDACKKYATDDEAVMMVQLRIESPAEPEEEEHRERCRHCGGYDTVNNFCIACECMIGFKGLDGYQAIYDDNSTPELLAVIHSPFQAARFAQQHITWCKENGLGKHRCRREVIGAPFVNTSSKKKDLLLEAAKEAQKLNEPIDVTIKRGIQACKDEKPRITEDEVISNLMPDWPPGFLKYLKKCEQRNAGLMVGGRMPDDEPSLPVWLRAEVKLAYFAGRQSVIGDPLDEEEKIL